RVGGLARRGEMGRHAAELVLRQLEVTDRPAELLPLARVGRGRLERRLREPGGPPAGLEPAGCEAGHLEVKALPLPLRLADQVLRRDDVVLEAEREGVHAAVAGCGVRLSVQHAAPELAHLELVARERI